MSQPQFLQTYSQFLQKFLKPQKPLKVVFDCSNGTAGLVLKKLKTKNLKLKTYFINDNPDGNFPAHGPNPLIAGAKSQLEEAVKKNQADLGIIFDADGDRMFCVDNKGNSVDPDIIAQLLIWQLKPQKVVLDVGTGWLVRKHENKNLKLITSKVGHYFIKQKMRAEKADFGAERSGHYYFQDFFGLDSGIMAAVQTINAVSRLPYKLSDFVEFLPCYYHQEIDIKLRTLGLRQQELLNKVENYYKKLPITNYQLQKISHFDGLTMEFKDWWFNLRFSQTEPLARLNIETTEKSKLQKKSNTIKKFLK